MLKRTEITIETDRLVVVSRRSESTVLWCSQCARMVTMLTIYQAARMLGLATSGLLHFAITPEGRLFICSDSLGLDGVKVDSLESPPPSQHFDVE
jgi:hypothetical protein